MNSEHSILVIDDEAIICESFTRILSKDGYKVDSKTEPYEGLELAISNKYDLVFLDLKMDKMDGMDLFNELRKKNPNVPVIIVTGYPSMDTAIESVKLHASDYILKPFTPEEILKSVNQIIPQKEILSTAAKAKLSKKTDWKASDDPIKFFEISWMQQGTDGSIRIGGQLPNFISSNVNEFLFPEVNDVLYAGLPLAGAVLSNKTKIMIPSPLSGKVIEVNHKLASNPSIIKENSFNESWIARIEPFDAKKDLQVTQCRNVTLLCKNVDEEKEYLPRLVDLGCIVKCVDTVYKAVINLYEEENKVIFIDAESLSDNGPEYVEIINQETPEAKVIIIGKPDSKFEEIFRKNKILYYCVSSLFNKEITDILYSAFTSIQETEVFESCPVSFIPQSIRKINITNKYGNKVTLLVFGDLLYNNKDIGYFLVNKLLEKSYPIKVARGKNSFNPEDSKGLQIIDKTKEENDIIIILQAKDSNKLPGQIHKKIEKYTNNEGSDCSIKNLVIQPKIIDENEYMIFNNKTTKAVAEFIFNEMASCV
ncbi:MAG: response regulator [Bacteroidales bacterium]|nr:response regulator [Bacteroidales bacterium]